MAYEKPKTRRKSLDDVLRDYKKISEATGFEPQATLFKSINDHTGQVFLITNPATWQERCGEHDKRYKQRPAPIPMGNINDLQTETKTPLALPQQTESWGVSDEF